MKLYRVTGFDPKTTREFNIGLFMANSREEAIQKAQTEGKERVKDLILDAMEVSQ